MTHSRRATLRERFIKLVGLTRSVLFDATLSRGWLAGWLGDEGEKRAAKYLRRQGYRILARRYRTPLGEIDLIARDGDCLVFVEVKTRRSTAQGMPHEAVDFHKQKQLTRLALAYLKRHRQLDTKARFDVVSIVWEETEAEPRISHYKNAFEPPGRGQLFS